MSITRVREEIVQRVNELDEPMLKALYTLLYGSSNFEVMESDVVPLYDSEVEATNASEIVAQYERDITHIKAGNSTGKTLEQLDDKYMTWLANSK